MPIRNAIYLLSAIENNADLRETLYQCADAEELQKCLTSRGYVFDNNEFEDAVNYLHVQCQTLENARLLLQKAEWLRFLLFVNEKAAS